MLKVGMMIKVFLILQMVHFGILMVYILIKKDMINMVDIMMKIKNMYQVKDGMRRIIVIRMNIKIIIMMMNIKILL